MKDKIFLVKVKSNQNDTWQGTVEWIDEKKEESFRSTLELIKLMDTAINPQDDQELDGSNTK